MVFLANRRLILGIEAKYSTNQYSTSNKAKEAAKQLKMRQEYIKKTFGDLLSQGWRYIPIIALDAPENSSIKSQCSHSTAYVLSNGTPEEQRKEMDELMDNLTSNTGSMKTDKYTGHHDFQHVFSRILGLSGLFMAVQKVTPYHHIMGSDAKSINSGWTQASALKFSKEQDKLRPGDMIGRPCDIYKLVFFNPDQIGLLALEHKCVIFLDDYGAGKFSF